MHIEDEPTVYHYPSSCVFLSAARFAAADEPYLTTRNRMNEDMCYTIESPKPCYETADAARGENAYASHDAQTYMEGL
jgi:hypothetical protein